MERSIRVGRWEVTLAVKEVVSESGYPIIPDDVTVGELFDPEWIESELKKVQEEKAREKAESKQEGQDASSSCR